ncbi:ferrous iron transport protein B [Thalassobacillus cyri]|uniref:Ferrous iron transport protein B n=1 Tax=Thalassobacillus cyri TaxID=571932 RepID=A0A1H4G5J1_9BACI|nr:ferrous iron transport protein B [Thalassobacillus cyri]SEB04869.1 ferrous iron transport protein B [Thalassobacillus cyri]
MQIALLGNPNTGKTSLFNSLTGSYQYVGNWSGVTVEKKVGSLRNGRDDLIDLPGIYSLNPLSKDEAVVSNFLLHESFEEMLNIVDASQLRRNLNLTIPLLEFGKPMVIGLNMTDVAKLRGIRVQEDYLSEELGVPVVPIIARSGTGIEFLEDELYEENAWRKPFKLDYGMAVENAIAALVKLMPKSFSAKRWLAIQFLEENRAVENFIYSVANESLLCKIRSELEEKLSKPPAIDIQDTRNKYIEHVIERVTIREKISRVTLTDKIDALATHKYLGLPIFLLLMYVMFMLTFNWLGFPLSDQLDRLFSGPLTSGLEELLGMIGASSFIHALVLDGIVAGVGGVLVFVPQIFILFFFISLLEDSGYMARVATVMDRVMQAIGLNGKSFIPMIIGFGCNVPGVMAARTVEQPKERLMTILLTPLMSCSARLPVYALFVGAFFTQNQAFVVLSIYLLGIILALLLAKLFSKTIFKQEESFFVMELPPYRLPQWTSLWRSTWDKGKGFVRKAGTFIFAGSVFIWLLTYAGPGGLDVPMDESFLALIGSSIAPLLAPIGFDNWQSSAALLTGFLAKEVVVSTMSIIYTVPDGTLQEVLATSFTPLAAYSFMVFILLYIPCLATIAAINKETGSRKWTLFSMAYALIIAYAVSFSIYQIGQWFIG